MHEQDPQPDLVLAGFINTESIAGEIRGVLLLMVALLAGYMVVQIYKGNARAAATRLAVVAIAVLVVGLAGSVLINPGNSEKVTEQIVNVDGDQKKEK